MTTNEQLTSPILSTVNPVNLKNDAKGTRIPCPVHQGTDLNFLLYEDESGYCFSTCSKRFSKKELYEHLNIKYSPEILTVEQFKQSFNFSDDDITKFDIKDNKKGKGIVVPYIDSDGQHKGSKYRQHLDLQPKYTSTKGFSPKTILYGANFLEEIHKKGYVLLVEGETDTIAAWKRDIPALGISGSSNWDSGLIKKYRLDELKSVFIWYEKDEASETLIEKIGIDLPNAIIVQQEKYKDISEMNRILEDPEEYNQLIRDSFNNNETAAKFKWKNRQEKLEEIIEDKEYQELINLDEKQFDEKLIKDIGLSGFAGNTATVLASILSINSKKLIEPFHLMLLAPSSSGKSFSIHTAIKFFPEDHVHIMNASTPAVFVYDTTDISKKALFVEEMDSLPQGDSPIASAVRSAMTKGILDYQNTKEDPAAARGRSTTEEPPRKTKSILTTGTKTPEVQTGTRILMMDVDFSSEQVKSNMMLQAYRMNGSFYDREPDVWKKHFEALEIKEPEDIEVLIPFSVQIVKAIFEAENDEMEERWNRDNKSLFGAIKSSAILHYRYRQKENGKLIAQYEDYEFVRAALFRAFQVSQKQGINDSDTKFLETIVQMESEGNPVSQKMVKTRLGVSAAYVSKMVKKLSKFIDVEGIKPKYLHVEFIPDAILLPTTKQVKKTKVAVTEAVEKKVI